MKLAGHELCNWQLNNIGICVMDEYWFLEIRMNTVELTQGFSTSYVTSYKWFAA